MAAGAGVVQVTAELMSHQTPGVNEKIQLLSTKSWTAAGYGRVVDALCSANHGVSGLSCGDVPTPIARKPLEGICAADLLSGSDSRRNRKPPDVALRLHCQDLFVTLWSGHGGKHALSRIVYRGGNHRGRAHPGGGRLG